MSDKLFQFVVTSLIEFISNRTNVELSREQLAADTTNLKFIGHLGYLVRGPAELLRRKIFLRIFQSNPNY